VLPLGEAFGLVAQIVICALVGFLGGYWILSGWFDRRLSAREAVLLGLGLIALMFYTMSMMFRGGPGTLVLSGAVFGTALLLKCAAAGSERSLTKHLDVADIAKYQEAIENYPDNPLAHSLLAEVYRRTGKLEPAAKEYEAALEIDPSLREERYWLERVRMEMDRIAEKQMACPRCGTIRRNGELSCTECGRLFSTLETWRHEFSCMNPQRQALWLAAALGLAVAAAAAIVFAPGVVKVAGLSAFLLAPVMLIVMSARMRKRTG